MKANSVKVLLVAISLLMAAQLSWAQEGNYVASRKGTVYYWSGCSAWKRLSASNRIYFESVKDAQRAGYRVSRSAGCGGPALDSAIASAKTFGERCVVEHVVDGDTFHCAPYGSIRLLLIDAPEMRQGPYGQVARQAAERLLPVGDTVVLEFDVQRRDRYRRVLAYVYLGDGRMVNREMVRGGLAVAWSRPPNVKHVDMLRAAADSARVEKLELWSGSAFECAPADFRAGKCR